MVYAVIENGVVTNVVEAAAAFANAQGWVKVTGNAAIGWGYDGTAFTPPAPSPRITNTNVLAAPVKGFGGPDGKELFNGNR